MIVDVIQKPVTYRALQWEDQGLCEETKQLLDGAKASLGGSFGQYLTHDFDSGKGDTISRGQRMQRVMFGDWIVVSSLGEVRLLTDEEYKNEFYEDWEADHTTEEQVVVLRGQLAYMAELMKRFITDDGFYYFTEDKITLDKIERNDW